MSRKPTIGGCLVIGQHVLKGWPKTQTLIALSSGESEHYATLKASSEGLGIISIACDLGIDLEGEVWADASAALGIIKRRGLGKTRHIDTGLLWIQDIAAERRFKFSKVLGRDDPADLYTKQLDWDTIMRHCSLMFAKFEDGRAEAAPELHNLRAAWEVDDEDDNKRLQLQAMQFLMSPHTQRSIQYVADEQAFLQQTYDMKSGMMCGLFVSGATSGPPSKVSDKIYQHNDIEATEALRPVPLNSCFAASIAWSVTRTRPKELGANMARRATKQERADDNDNNDHNHDRDVKGAGAQQVATWCGMLYPLCHGHRVDTARAAPTHLTARTDQRSAVLSGKCANVPPTVSLINRPHITPSPSDAPQCLRGPRSLLINVCQSNNTSLGVPSPLSTATGPDQLYRIHCCACNLHVHVSNMLFIVCVLNNCIDALNRCCSDEHPSAWGATTLVCGHPLHKEGLAWRRSRMRN